MCDSPGASPPNGSFGLFHQFIVDGTVTRCFVP